MALFFTDVPKKVVDASYSISIIIESVLASENRKTIYKKLSHHLSFWFVLYRSYHVLVRVFTIHHASFA
jgi:hypothetical protein